MSEELGVTVDGGTWGGAPWDARLSRVLKVLSARDWTKALGGVGARAAGWWRDGDVPWFRDISIQARFNLLIGVAMTAAILVGGAFAIGERRIDAAITDQTEFQRIGEQTANMRAGALAMQTAANGLIAERQRKFIDDFNAQDAAVNAALTAVKATPVAVQHEAEIADLDRSVAAVTAQFKKVTDVTLALGLTESDGLRGRLGSSVKAIETELAMWPNADDLKTRLLRMRQAEKDFMIYQEDSYLGKHRKFAAEFDLGIDTAAMGNSTKDDFRAMATKYSADMAAYGQVHLDQQAQIAQMRTMFASLQPRIAAFAVMARDGMAEATRRQDQTRSNVALLTALVGSLALLTFLGVGLISGRSIARPVLAMEGAMNRLAGGEITIEIPGTHRADEVGLMAKAVRVFRDNALAMDALRIRQDAEQAAKELRSRKLEGMIASFDADVGAIIRAVALSATGSETTAKDMEAFVGQTVSQMRSVDESSGQATSNVQAMAAAAEQLAYSVSEISSRVNDASQLANRAAHAAERTDGIVRSLFNVTQRIDTVITFIQTIASQTRLLALNATIEAARAGEHGHGFTIVANEVKQLATQTAKATQEIASQISAVQSAGRDAVEAISEISVAVRQVNEITGTIAAAVEEQGSATSEIARSAQEAAQSTTMVASSISWVVNEAAGMQSAAGKMLDASGQLSGQSEVLRAVVDNFLMGVNDGELTLKWGDNWLTGHAVIDADHKMLVQYVNDLSTAMTYGKGGDVTGEILAKLAQYTVEHFAREEAIWAEGGLATLDDHRRIHADLVGKVLQFQADLTRGKATLTIEMMVFLRDWLMNHVFKADKACAQEIAAAWKA